MRDDEPHAAGGDDPTRLELWHPGAAAARKRAEGQQAAPQQQISDDEYAYRLQMEAWSVKYYPPGGEA